MTTAADERLERLMGFLAHDPRNGGLVVEAAGAALDARRPDLVEGMIGAYETDQPPTPAMLNLRALAGMAEDRFGDAAEAFEALLAQAPLQPTLRFNLAWAKAMLGEWQAVVDLVDVEVVASAPRAAGLKVQALHHLGLLEDALAWGQSCEALAPDDADLYSALCVVAIDDEKLDLAEIFARRAGKSHEGLSTLGMLELNEQKVDEALAHFNAALAVRPDSARSLLGKGLAQLLTGETAEATEALDRSAEVFGDHLGSWISAGWAHFSAGHMDKARARFEHALELDQTFAESHGALAVMDVIGGDLESGRKRAEIAQRLDRRCLSAALAQSLLLAADGRADAAERVRSLALNQPIGPNGETLMAMMGRFGPMISGRKPRGS